MKKVFALILVMALMISCCPGISVQASVQNEKPKDPLFEDNSKENAELNPGGFKPGDQESGDLESGDVIESTDPVDPALPKDVQEKTDEAAKMREKTAEYITGGYCPLCDGEVTWTRTRTTISVSGGAVSHRYMTGNLSLTTSGYPIRVLGSGTKLHLILYDANVQINGMIQVGNDSSENVELAIIGTGSISTTGTRGENNNKTIGQGLFRMRGDSPTLILNGGTYTNTYTNQNNEVSLINTYNVASNGRVDMYPGTVIGPETMSTTVDAYNVHLTNTTMNMYGGTIRNGTRVVSTWGGGANVSIKANSTLNMYGGTIENSYSSWAGSNISLTTNTSQMNLYGGTVSGGMYAEGYNGNGGNIYLASSGAQLNMYGGTVTGGTAKATGGNIYSDSSTATVNISGGTVSGGKAKNGGNIGGWGAFNISGNALITGGYASNNGGNLMVTTGAKLAISGGTIADGSAGGTFGGNIHLQASSLNMSGGTVSGGTVPYFGGNISASNDTASVINITGGTIKDGVSTCTTTAGGGNLMFYKGATIRNATISGGTCPNAAGSIACYGGALTVSNSTITGGSTSGGSGGNIWVGSNTTVVLRSGTKVEDGTAMYNGGNIYIYRGNLTITDTTVSGGTAKVGGNIFKYGGADSTDANNYTLQYVKIRGASVIKGGKAFAANGGMGGNIYVAGMLTLEDTSQVKDGQAGEEGANICISSAGNTAGNFTLLGGAVTGDPAEGISNVYISNSKMYMGAGAVTSSGKAIGLSSSTMAIDGDAVVSTVYIDGTSKLQVSKNWIGSANIALNAQYDANDVIISANGTYPVQVGTVTVDLEKITMRFTAGGVLAGDMKYAAETYSDIVSADTAIGSVKLSDAPAVAKVGGTKFNTLEAALSVATEGQTIVLLQDSTLEEMFLRSGRTLDLNGCKLTVTGEAVAANATTNIIDSTNGSGILAVGREDISFNFNNAYLPVWRQGEGFRFVKHSFTAKFRTADTHPSEELAESAVQLRFWLDGEKDCLLAQQLTDGGSDNGIRVKIKLTWTSSTGFACEQYFTFTEELVKKYATNADADNNWATNVFTLTVNGARNVADLSFSPMIAYAAQDERTSVKLEAPATVVQENRQEVSLQAGYKRVDITPNFPVALGGYDSGDSRLSTAVLDKIYITCIAFREEGETVLLYTVDNCALSESEQNALRELVEAETGVPGHKQFFGATHTHSAPSLSESLTNGVQYMTLFHNAAVDAAVGALADLAPAQPMATSTTVSGLNFARQYQLKNGQYTDTKPSYSVLDVSKSNYYTNYSGFATEADNNMVLLKFDREEKQDILLVNWQAHADHSSSLKGPNGGNTFTMVSADFPGALREKIMEETGMHVAYFTGAGGNAVADSPFNDSKHGLSMTQYGEALADEAIAALTSLQVIEGSGISTKYVRFGARVDHSRDDKLEQANEVYEKYKETYNISDTRALANSYGMQSAYEARAIIINASLGETYAMDTFAIRIGGIGFVSGGYEMFSNEATYIKNESPYDATFIVTTNNGYIASSYAFDNFYYNADLTNTGCYEAVTGKYAKGTAEDLAQHFISMLKDIQ